MIIRNAYVFTEKQTFEKQNIFIDGDRFVTAADSAEVVDGSGCYAIPGLIDSHFHGCMGYDFCDGTTEALEAICRYEAANGVTGIVPATMSLEEECLESIVGAAASFTAGQAAPEDGSVLWGIHMEGPFLSKKRKGAQNSAWLRKPDGGMFRRLQKVSGGLIRIVTLAPELEGAMDFIDEFRGETVLSMGHTAADYQTACEAVRRGARHVTHLYNGMNSWHHREPGLVGAAFDCGGCMAELICDGLHVHPSAVRAAFRLLGSERLILVSDTMRAAGLGDGIYELGGQEVTVRGKRALLADGTIAGSVTNLMDCLRTAVLEMGIPLETAVACANVNPARCLGVYDRTGSIAPGKRADLVLLERGTLALRRVFLAGEPVPVEKPAPAERPDGR